MRHKFDVGTHIWFILGFENGSLTHLEEHDWRDGGCINYLQVLQGASSTLGDACKRVAEGKTLEMTFYDAVAGRVPDADKKLWLESARNFCSTHRDAKEEAVCGDDEMDQHADVTATPAAAATATGGSIQIDKPNLCMMTDSYKVSHYKQYPPNTTNVYSYFESRGGEFPSTTFFGLQYYLKKYLTTKVTQADINEACEFFDAHFGQTGVFNRKGWEHIVNRHGGMLPVRIKAVPEGTVVPNRNVLMTIENTDPECYWLTNWLETMLVQVWYGSTVASQSRAMKKTLLDFLHRTGDPSLIDFKLHDFGYRGVSSVETAGVGGAAHLVNFKGTDTVAGLVCARDYYGEPMAGFSIPAAEHSTITSWGLENEVDAFRNMLTAYPTGLVAVVSDSKDIFAACSELWGKQLKTEVLERDGVLVVRPDSGDPPPTVVKVLQALAEAFGGEYNDKGYLVLNPKVRVIQGDGIDPAMLTKILEATTANKFSADNITFGSGGGLLQKLNRDTLKFAFKCSSVVVDGEQRDVYKDPITDTGKSSKRGRLKLITKAGAHGPVFETVAESDPGDDLLRTVYLNGEVTREYDFEAVRRNAERTMWL
jgi:nicotinamide phosphoribosyltransferase